VDAAVPAVAVGAGVVLATAVVAFFLPAGRSNRHAEVAGAEREQELVPA
jgi:hypothetical protein